MIKVVDSINMQESDRLTIEGGVPALVLMQRAAESIFKEIDREGKIAIVAGLGNNGGDGFALAAMLKEYEIDADIFTFNGRMSDSAAHNYRNALNKEIKVNFFNVNTSFKDYPIIIDCIFGTGLSRPIEGQYYEAIKAINASRAYIISADIPSGLNSDNGRVMGIAVQADKTVSLGAIKCGHMLNDGKDYTGELVNYDIGIDIKGYYNLIEKEDIKEFFPKRRRNINKGDSGKLLIIGGSSMYMGAAILSYNAAAAIMCGAGLVTCAIPRSYLKEMMSRIKSETLYPAPDSQGNMLYDEILINKVKDYDAIAIGMGMGDKSDTLEYLRALVNMDINLIIDADAINILAQNLDILDNSKAHIIITPHPKEMSRLTGHTVNEILDRPVEIAKDFSNKYKLTTLLKGSVSVITDGDNIFLSDSGAPSMAKGGSGDVLSGIIGALLARGTKPIKAAWCGAYLAGLAGEAAAKLKGEYSASPEDTIDNIPNILMSLN